MRSKPCRWLWLLPLVVLAGLVTGLLLSAQAPQAGQKKVAFLVGVNQYLKPGFDPLCHAEGDVEQLGEVLGNNGFSVVILTGSAKGDLKATLENINKQLTKLMEKVTKDDLVLVALCGHGQRLPVKKGSKELDDFFCPVDAVLGKPEKQFSISYLLHEVLAKNAGKSLILVDACRSRQEDSGRGARGVQGTSSMALPQNTAVLFSCTAGERSFEQPKEMENGHGLFTLCVLEALRGKAVDDEGNVEWLDLVRYVRNRMKKKDIKDYLKQWNEDQTPIPAINVGEVVLLRVDNSRSKDSGEVRRDSQRSVPPFGQREPERAVAPFDEAKAKELQRAWAKHLGRKVVEEVDLGGGMRMEFVLIPPGKFIMGQPKEESGFANEETARLLRGQYEDRHEVEITRAFYLGKYEVTQEQYKKIVGKNPSAFSASGWEKEKVKDLDTSCFPVDEVSWEDAVAFCSKLTDRDGKRHFRLPSEAEWEYACRAGTTTPYHFGKSLNGDKANCDGRNPYGTEEEGQRLERTCRVGSYAAAVNAFGSYDMHGNVCEWCQDYFGPYKGLERKDPLRKDKGDRGDHALRGGSWEVGATRCRAGRRDSCKPGDYDYASVERGRDCGFRVAFRPD